MAASFCRCGSCAHCRENSAVARPTGRRLKSPHAAKPYGNEVETEVNGSNAASPFINFFFSGSGRGLALIASALFLIVVWIAAEQDQEAAFTACLKRSSFDTCFEALHP
jgi:hypothetical protein